MPPEELQATEDAMETLNSLITSGSKDGIQEVVEVLNVFPGFLQKGDG